MCCFKICRGNSKQNLWTDNTCLNTRCFYGLFINLQMFVNSVSHWNKTDAPLLNLIHGFSREMGTQGCWQYSLTDCNRPCSRYTERSLSTKSWYLQVRYLWQRCSGTERISSRDITINRLRWWSDGCRRTWRPVTGLPSANTDITSITCGLISRRPLLIAFKTRPLSVTSQRLVVWLLQFIDIFNTISATLHFWGYNL